MSFSYLALGDSYTIGEQVMLAESFPYQAVQLLRKAGKPFAAPEIIAKTGWTTDELLQHMATTQLLPVYDWVSLLIGVNNQYRGRPVENYKLEFTTLLQKALALSGSRPQRVMVFSIPDWGVTPFAKEKDGAKIAHEIDQYNEACRLISQNAGCFFIDITSHQRQNGFKAGYLAQDGLHPGGLEYAHWAKAVYEYIATNL